MPSKALLRPGEVLAEVAAGARARRPRSPASSTSTPCSRGATTSPSHWDDDSQVEWLEGAGGVLVRGHGRLVGERRVDVDAPDGTVRELEATKAVVLATGSSAVIPPIDGLRDVRPWDSRDVTSAKAVPERLLVLGGGVVGVEMAQAWKRLGAREVTVIDSAPTPGRRTSSRSRATSCAPRSSTRASRRARRRRGRDGRRARRPTTARSRSRSTTAATFTGDELLVAVGRRPNTADLGLDTVGLEPGKPVEVDDQLRATGRRRRLALRHRRRATAASLLTHMGKYQARIAADAILNGSTVTAWADHRAVPSVVFTDPQLAMVGLTEAKAREQGIDVKVVSYGTGDVAGASVHGKDITGHVPARDRRRRAA